MSGSNSSDPAAAQVLNVKPEVEAVSFTVHSVSGPDLADPALAGERRTRVGRLKMLLVLAICAAPVIASYLTYYVMRPDGRTNYGTLILPTRSLPDLPLRSLDGAAVAASSLKGQWLMVVVAPASCDAACEQRLYLQRQLREMMGRDRDRIDKVWFVTDDTQPRPALREATGGGVPVTVLRAPREALAAWLQPEPGHALEEHVYIVDPLGEWMMRMPPNPEPNKVKRDVERLLRASAGWHKPGR
jgi:hypothetical protein